MSNPFPPYMSTLLVTEKPAKLFSFPLFITGFLWLVFFVVIVGAFLLVAHGGL